VRLRLSRGHTKGAGGEDLGLGLREPGPKGAPCAMVEECKYQTRIPISHEMKAGRNERCPCGSGKKYKRCCIDNPKPQANPFMAAAPPEMMRRAQEIMRLHEAQEDVRQQQQGHGNPILSWTDHGYRLVAVGNTIHWAKNWVLFPNFLDYFMKKTLGHEWGEREKSKGEHPIFRWLEKT
jgi:hypothetical protein